MRAFHFGVMVAAALAGGVALGCGSDTSGPTERPAAQLNILHVALNAPPLFNTDTTFLCTKGQECEGRIYFQDGQGGRGEEFARLRLDSGSLQRRPDGTFISVGDTVWITMRVVSADSALFEFEPAGLRFNREFPAELKVEYGECGEDEPGDFDGNGIPGDSGDVAIERMLSLWRQENPGEKFVKIGTAQSEDLNEAEAEITGFTRFALAY